MILRDKMPLQKEKHKFEQSLYFGMKIEQIYRIKKNKWGFRFYFKRMNKQRKNKILTSNKITK